MNHSSVCRDMLIHLATPAEEKYMGAYDAEEALNRGWLLLGKATSVSADIFFRYENLLDEHQKLLGTHKACERTFKDNWVRFKAVTDELEKVKTAHAGCAAGEPEELKQLRVEQIVLKDSVAALEAEKEEWRGVSANQANTIRLLEEELKKAKAKLVEEEKTSQDLRKEYQDLAISAGHNEIDKNNIVKKFIPEMVRRLLNSYEYKKTLAEPFNLYSQSGFIDGVHVGREPEEARSILEEVEEIDLDAGAKYQSVYDALFTKEYPYIRKIQGTPSLNCEELMKIFPDPAPSVEATVASEQIGDPGMGGSSGPDPSSGDPSGSVFL